VATAANALHIRPEPETDGGRFDSIAAPWAGFPSFFLRRGLFMHIILGGTGHVGAALCEALVVRGEPVTVVTRNSSRTQELQRKGLQVAVANVFDTDALRAVFRQGERLFLLNPSADPSTDTDVEERRGLGSILAAIDGSGLHKIVAESTYGAQPVDRGGDLGILWDMEQALSAQPIPASIIRAAYYMSNWDASLNTALTEGVVHSFYPADFKLPMVAPRDIGHVAARLMTEAVKHTGVHYVEGPQRYCASDVAAAFAAALRRPIETVVTPRGQWIQAFKAMGFSDEAAHSYANMTSITLDGRPPPPDAPVRGDTSLQEYVMELARRKAA
jgi:uncharacterized protein YbjT (DUF2867 family)